MGLNQRISNKGLSAYKRSVSCIYLSVSCQNISVSEIETCCLKREGEKEVLKKL